MAMFFYFFRENCLGLSKRTTTDQASMQQNCQQSIVLLFPLHGLWKSYIGLSPVTLGCFVPLGFWVLVFGFGFNFRGLGVRYSGHVLWGQNKNGNEMIDLHAYLEMIYTVGAIFEFGFYASIFEYVNISSTREIILAFLLYRFCLPMRYSLHCLLSLCNTYTVSYCFHLYI